MAKYKINKGHDGEQVTVFLPENLTRTITISDKLTDEEVQLLVAINHPAISIVNK